MDPPVAGMTARFARALSRPPSRAALRIAVGYAVFGAAWILLSDVVVNALFSHRFIAKWHIQTIKGWFFIAATALMLYFFIRRAFAAIRQSERARQEIETRTRMLVERVRDYAIFTLDPRGHVTSWNRGAQQITDWTEDEILGKPYSVFHPDSDAAKAQRDLDRAAGEGWMEEEFPRIREDGSEFWANTLLTSLKDDAGKPAGFLVVMRDVTDRRRAQAALQRVNQTLAAMIERSPVAIVTIDNAGKITSWNPAAERLYGWRADEVIGQTPPMIPEWRQQTFDANSVRLQQGERIAAMEVPGIRKDGSLVDVALWAAPLLDDQGKMIGNVRIYADMTERKQAEQEIRLLNETLERRVKERTARLEEANEELSAFSYTVSHDLRIPLRSLQQLASHLLAPPLRDQLPEEAAQHALRIVGAAARMEGQIEELLEYSRASRSELAGKAEPISLILIVHELLGRIERDPLFKDAQVSVQEPLGWVMAHRLTLAQVILNLLTNAITFVAPGTRPMVRISATEHDEFVRVRIEDNGIGIPADDRERVFQLFERLPAGERCAGGAGVGLSVVRRGVERMGGTIEIDSTPGRGTTFIISLPRARPT